MGGAQQLMINDESLFFLLLRLLHVSNVLKVSICLSLAAMSWHVSPFDPFLYNFFFFFFFHLTFESVAAANQLSNNNIIIIAAAAAAVAV